MTLAPCPRCKRHVATSAPACPFCGAAIQHARPQHVTLVGRVSRAAVFSAALVACSNEKPAPAPAPPAAPGSGSDDLEKLLDQDEGTVAHPNAPAPADAAAVPDAAIADAGVPDAGTPDAGVVIKKKKKKQQQQIEETVKTIEIDRMQNAKPYGAPPMRRRVV